jgi:hypothetical protein
LENKLLDPRQSEKKNAATTIFVNKKIMLVKEKDWRGSIGPQTRARALIAEQSDLKF